MGALGKRKVMVVDDSLDILEVITMVLEMEGFEVLGIPDGLHFSSSFVDFEPDLVLLDVMLGEVDGRDLCNFIKSSKVTSHIPVIMISASHGMKNMEGYTCRPDDFIAKPFDIYDLVDRVKSNLAA